MKSTFAELLCSFLFITCGVLKAQVPKQVLYSFCSADTLLVSNNVTQYVDDSFILVAGNTESPGITNYCSYLGKLDRNLNLVKKQDLYSPGKYNAVSGGPNILLKTGDNRYILSGLEITFTWKPLYFPYFYFFNSNLDSIGLVKHVDSTRERIPYAVIQDRQKGYIIAGVISDTTSIVTYSGAISYDTFYSWVAHYDSNANLLWERKFFGPFSVAHEISATNDGSGYIISGQRVTAADAGENYIMRLDTAGNMVWNKPVRRRYTAIPDDMDHIKLGDKYFFVTDYTDTMPGPGGPYNCYFYYGRFDENGDMLWTKHQGYNHIFYQSNHATPVNENKWLLYGTSYYDGFYHPAVMALDTNGAVQTYREYLYNDSINVPVSEIAAVTGLNGSQILLSGDVRANAVPGVFDTSGILSWFILTDTSGCLRPGCHPIDTGDNVGVRQVRALPTDISLYPNPAHDVLNIKTGATGAVSAALLSTDGKVYFNETLKEHNIKTISLHDLSPGFYTLLFYKDGKIVRVSKLSHW